MMAVALLSQASAVHEEPCRSLRRLTVDSINGDGLILVRQADGSLLCCEVLLTLGNGRDMYQAGTEVLVLSNGPTEYGICLGPVGPLSTPKSLKLDATASLSLNCGEASIDLRADGKVMVRGEDVLVRAKGTKRIRAGTVAIN